MEELIRLFSQLFWSLIRIGGFVMVVPVFGNQLVSPRIKLALSLAIAIPVASLLSPMPLVTDLDLALLLEVPLQLFAGIGLGFAAMVDPGNGVQVTALSQFYLMLVTLTFLAANGHLVVLDVLIAGFKAFPTGIAADMTMLAGALADLGGWMFLGGVLVALPAVVSLLVVNLAFGVMSRSAPQLNVFSLGFPFSLVFGLVILWLSLNGFLPQFDRLADEFLNFAGFWSA